MTEGSAGGHDSQPGDRLPARRGQEADNTGIPDEGGSTEAGSAEAGSTEAGAGNDGAAGSAAPAAEPDPGDTQTSPVPPVGDTYALYRRGLDLLGRGSAAAAAQLLERAAAAEPESRSVLEALGRAQFDARRYAAAAGSFRKIVDASPSDDYAQFGLGLALARTGDPAAAAEHLALAVAMRPELPHYNDALRSVRATLRARRQARKDPGSSQTGAAQ